MLDGTKFVVKGAGGAINAIEEEGSKLVKGPNFIYRINLKKVMHIVFIKDFKVTVPNTKSTFI